jgi:GNAT superfamily N-acetyltransferase
MLGGRASYRRSGVLPGLAVADNALVPAITIIRADLSDPLHREGIVRVTDSYARDPIGRSRGLDPDAARRLVPGIDAHPLSVVFLALADGEPVGIATCFGTFSSFDARPAINIHDLAILPEWRGSGLGRRLLERVEEHARELGCGKLTLEVKERNARARRLYRGFGFDDPPGEAAPDSKRVFFLEKKLDGPAGAAGAEGGAR